MKPSHTIRGVFDDPNLVGAAGLARALGLAGSAGMYGLLEQLSVPSPNAATKSAGVVAGMLAGADSIDDLDLLRHGGMPRLFVGVRAPSRLGTFLRSFTHGHVQQLDAVGGRLLAGLAGRVPALLAGAGGIAFVDVDDTIRQVHGYAKQAAAYGYSGVRGLNVQLATISSPVAAPVIARARLRRRNTASAAGAGRLLAQAISTARNARGGRAAALPGGQRLLRVGRSSVPRCGTGRGFSVTARMDPKVRSAIGSIDEDAWVTIKYPNAVWDEAEQRWISDTPRCPTSRSPAAARPSRRPAGWSCAASGASNRSPATAASRTSCSPPGATTPSSPTPP